MSYPSDLKYTPTHEWARIEGGEAVIGISSYAAHELGELVYVELPETGEELEAGTEFGVVESVKAASDLVAPLSGEVIAVNDAAVDSPKLVNDDPFAKGWLVRIKLSNPAEAGKLLDAQAYTKLVGE